METESPLRSLFGDHPHTTLVAETREFAIFFVDKEGCILSWNEGARLLFGYEPEEIIGESFVLLFTPEDQQEGVPQLELETAFRQGRAEDVRWHLRKDGSEFWANGVTKAILDEEGQLRGFAKIARDDTQRKRAETEHAHLSRRLAFERGRLKAIFETTPAFVAVLRGEEHIFEMANPKYYQLVGHREIVGKGLIEALPEIEGQGFVELLSGVLHSGELFEGREVPVKLQREPGGAVEERLVDLLYLPLREADGTVSGVFSHGVDVTDQARLRREAEDARREAEEAHREAEEANRIKDEFLATLSHELRTPLNAIMGWANLLQTGRLSAEDAARGLASIERNARAQSQLVEDILDVSRVITGKMRLNIQPVDLAKVLEDAINTVLPATQAKGIRLQRVFDAGATVVPGDPARLQQVVWNLLSNAIKFTPNGGRVQVRLEHTASHVEVVVTDTGMGIAPEVLPHIFDRFRQADSSSTRAHGGLGLGLAIVRHLAELHGGSVEAHSEGLGQGSTFTLKMPFPPVHALEGDREAIERMHPRGNGNSSSTPAGPRLDGVHVLVVDDQEDARLLLSVMLDAYGARVTTVASAAQALATLQEMRPDVLLSDIGMPEEDGYSLIQRVRALPSEQGGGTPAIALTAFARVEDSLKALRLGFQHHIAKPIEAPELVTTMAHLLEKRSVA